LPSAPAETLIIAADGSQINPDWHNDVSYGLVNIGTIAMRVNTAQAPDPRIDSRLFLEDDLYTQNGTVNESMIALIRDERERSVLAELAAEAGEKVVTITDGPIELWNATEVSGEFQKHFKLYLEALRKLQKLDSITAGYVDKPRSDLVVRLLEIAALDDARLDQVGKDRPLSGVRDADLFFPGLQPGERSAVFAIQSKAAKEYTDNLALHFFYLNVSMNPKKKWVARVEVPEWVVTDKAKLDAIHAVFVAQCQILNNKPFPYLLHRAHETALVTRQEKEQIDQMIIQELLGKQVPLQSKSNKQFHKDNK
jgi:hypothetical protein